MNLNENEPEVPPSNHNPIPRWLKLTYLILPFWGILAFYLYWNGSKGWLDRGSWEQLQKAANTTYPFNRETAEQVEQDIESSHSSSLKR
jgi:hypothetical protein